MDNKQRIDDLINVMRERMVSDESARIWNIIFNKLALLVTEDQRKYMNDQYAELKHARALVEWDKQFMEATVDEAAFITTLSVQSQAGYYSPNLQGINNHAFNQAFNQAVIQQVPPGTGQYQIDTNPYINGTNSYSGVTSTTTPDPLMAPRTSILKSLFSGSQP